MPTDPALLQAAIEAVLRAGEIQMARLGRELKIEKKSAIDLVTQVDIEIETMFREMVAERFPSHAVLAEELPNVQTTDEPTSGYCWIFDPIDGTVNYAHGLPIFCTSLALEIDGKLEIGAVYDPTREELFVAERGGGARLNGSPLVVSSTTKIVNAMLCTGFPYDVHQAKDDVVGLFGAFVKRARAVRRLGSAALDLCYIAAGRLDGFWEQRLRPWDVAAAVLIIEEAGGQVTDLHGGAFSSRNGDVLASNSHLQKQMLLIISEFLATRSRNRTV